MPRKYIKSVIPRQQGAPHRKYKHSREAPEEFARKFKCGKCEARFFTESAKRAHRRLFHGPKEFWGESLSCLIM